MDAYNVTLTSIIEQKNFYLVHMFCIIVVQILYIKNLPVAGMVQYCSHAHCELYIVNDVWYSL